MGELDEAAQSHGKVIRLNPKYTKAHLNRGIALSMLGHADEAKQDFDFSQQLLPKWLPEQDSNFQTGDTPSLSPPRPWAWRSWAHFQGIR